MPNVYIIDFLEGHTSQRFRLHRKFELQNDTVTLFENTNWKSHGDLISMLEYETSFFFK